MNRGYALAAILGTATAALIVAGTVWPASSAKAYVGAHTLMQRSSTAEEAVRNLGEEIRSAAWGKAYASLANKAEFTEGQFREDLTGSYPNLRTYSALDHFGLFPLHANGNEAEVRLNLYWSTVVGTSVDSRDLHLMRDQEGWKVQWPIVKEAAVPPQVIPVNYLRWDVIYPGAGDDWGVQGVDAPHVRIVDMHPVERAEGVVILGELLNDDTVPALVSVDATLASKDGNAIATEGCFDKISHILLPKQVTPFLISFPDHSLSEVGSIRMKPYSTLVPASADPVIEIEDEHLSGPPLASLSGQLVNMSGQVVNVAHVLGTFYDKSGQLIWVADQYVDRALLPQTPAEFQIHIPEDLAKKVSSERTVISPFSFGGVL